MRMPRHFRSFFIPGIVPQFETTERYIKLLPYFNYSTSVSLFIYRIHTGWIFFLGIDFGLVY